LVGKWQEVSNKETIEFLKDGSFQGSMVWDMTKTPVNISGTYSVEGDLVSLRPSKPTDLLPMTLKFKLSNSNNELTITFQQGGAVKLDGSTSNYRRIG
jgi:argininosuccinate synthase